MGKAAHARHLLAGTRSVTRVGSWALAVAVAAAVLLGFLWRDEREARKRLTHDVTADSLARNTQESTAALTAADTVYVRTDRHYTQVRTLVDTVTLSPEARAVIRSCDALHLACAERSRRSDSVIRNLRAELVHALDPPPGPRLSWRIRGGRDLLAREWEGSAGPRYRIAGPIEAYAELGARPFRDSTGVRRNEARIVIGGEITFGGGRRQ